MKIVMLSMLVVLVSVVSMMTSALPAGATGPSVSLPQSFTETCQTSIIPSLGSTCYYFVTPSTVLPLSGSGFSSSDTYVTLSGIPSDTDSSERCNVSNGAFSCDYVVPDVPNDDLDGRGDTSLVATGSSGDSVKLPLEIDFGSGIYPTSGPPGTVVHVYGDYLGAIKFLADTVTAVTFGTSDPSGLQGTGPAVIYNSAPANNDYCIAGTDGSLNDHGACTFTVPGYSQGSYKVGILIGALWSVPDLTACGNTWCVSTFTIIPPSVSVSTQEATKGSTIVVSGTGFATTDTSAKILWRGADITPSSGCPFTTSPSGSNLSCSIQVPTSDLASAGPNSITVVGIQYGDYASTEVDIPGPYLLSVSSSQVTLGSTITVSGISFDPSDTSVTLHLFQPSSSGPVCPVTSGSFSCFFTIPSNTLTGSTSIFAQGNNAGDYDFADLTIVQTVALSQASGPIGTTVTFSGNGFDSRGEIDAVSATFDGQSLPITVTETNDVIGFKNDKPVYYSYVGSCPTQNGDGSIPAPSYVCSFTVPTFATTGSNAVTLTDEFGNSASTKFTLTPSITLFPTVGSAGSQILLTGYGFPLSNQPANFQLNGISLTSDCIPSASGSLSCNLTVPSLSPGNYTLEAIAASEQIPPFFSYSPVANATFTLVPSISLGSTKGVPDSTISVQVAGISPDDSNVAVYLNSTRTNSICIPYINPIISVTKAFTCATTVPIVPPHSNYIIKAVGNNDGDSAIANFTVSGLSISPLAGQASTIIDINGYGFDPSDTSATFSIGGESPSVTSPQHGTSSNGCPVSDGTFACNIQTPILAGGTQPIVATGNIGDQLSAPFTVVPETLIFKPAMEPPQGPTGTDVTMGGNGFLASDKSVTVSFNGQNVGTCPVTNGSYFCSPLFKVPSSSPGTYYVVTNGSSSIGDEAVNQFVVTLPPDAVSPITTDTLSGTQGANGWYTSSVSVSLNATDNTGGSGVKATSYSLDGGPQTAYSVPFTVTGDANHTLTFNSTDNAGNVESTNLVYVAIDTTPPVITVPSDVTQEATGPLTSAMPGAATAIDAVDGSVTVTNNATANYLVGTTTIQYSATDLAGNTATAYSKVTIADTTPPALQLPTEITVQATGPSGATVSYKANATDLVDGPVTPVCSTPSGNTFAYGNTTVTCTATDIHGNKATGTFDVNVQNKIPPELSIASPNNNAIINTATVQVSGTASDVVSVSAISWKVDSGAVLVVSGVTPGPNVVWSFTTGTLSLGSHTIQVNATDSAGLVAIYTISVTYAAPIDSISSPTGGGQIVFTSNSGGFTSLDSIQRSSLPTPPPGSYPLGFFSWDITGFAPANSVTVTVTSPVHLHQQSHYFKLVGNAWVNIPVTVRGNTMTFTITDNGPFDGNPITGVISDPAGVADPTDGRITGGGNIGLGTNFGFEVTSDLDKSNSIKGTFEYQDRYVKLNMHSNDVSFLSVDPTVSQATIIGTTNYDRHDKHEKQGTDYTFISTISDPDKTGEHDIFSITVTNSTGFVVYQNAGIVKGHIEIHKFFDHDDKSDSGLVSNHNDSNPVADNNVNENLGKKH